jgi:hypothetical protein
MRRKREFVMDRPADQELLPDRCMLEHQVFRQMTDVYFRRAEADGTPVMVMALGERIAAVPLRSLQREFSIPDDSADGMMLRLIAESLDYVNALHVGDLLPTEVLTGEASWEPDPSARDVVARRLRWQLLNWLDGEAAQASALRGLRGLDSDPAMRLKVQQSFDKAATALGLDSAAEVVNMVENLAGELSYIETLREQLMRPVNALHARTDKLAQGGRGDGQRAQTITQVHRLTAMATRQLAARFDAVDSQSGEVMAALRNMESHQVFIRSNRDLLYRSHRAWAPLLKLWAENDPDAPETLWPLIMKTYQFLAPRFMSVQEWHASHGGRGRKSSKKLTSAMAW